jgi:hypothetical protein
MLLFPSFISMSLSSLRFPLMLERTRYGEAFSLEQLDTFVYEQIVEEIKESEMRRWRMLHTVGTV